MNTVLNYNFPINFQISIKKEVVGAQFGAQIELKNYINVV